MGVGATFVDVSGVPARSDVVVKHPQEGSSDLALLDTGDRARVGGYIYIYICMCGCVRVHIYEGAKGGCEVVR